MKNNKKKQIGAWIAIIVLLLAACMPMFFAFGKGENAGNYFRAAIGVAIIVPVLAYAMWMVYRILDRDKKKERNSVVENIIFDVGKVLVKFEWEAYLDSFEFTPEKRDKIAKAVFLSDTWNERHRGSYEEEYYVNQMVKAAPDCEAEIRAVMKDSGKTIEKMEYADTWVRYLKDKGYKVYILSNYGNETMRMTKQKLTFLKYVDGAVFSCDVKQIKPEPEIYRTLIERYHLEPEKSVFLDDRKENCEAAEKFGIHAIQFQSFKQGTAELEKLGVK